MVRTSSATQRRSFAQYLGAGAQIRNADWFSLSTFIVAALVQSVLLAGLVLFQIFGASGPAVEIAQLLGVLALLTSGCMACALVTGNAPGREAAEPAELVVEPARPQQRHTNLAAHGFRNSDVEQLIRLKQRVSHELRTPLNAVIGFSEMMHREVLGPVGNDRYREYAAHIKNSAERFQLATESTLAVTELLTSRAKPQQATFDLARLVEATLADFRQAAGSAKPSWDITSEARLLVEGDRARLECALGHLWKTGRALALVGDGDEEPHCSVICRRDDHGDAMLQFTINGREAAALAHDLERAPGVELSLFLAELSIEAAGGTLITSAGHDGTWQATVRLPRAAQRELQLH